MAKIERGLQGGVSSTDPTFKCSAGSGAGICKGDAASTLRRYPKLRHQVFSDRLAIASTREEGMSRDSGASRPWRRTQQDRLAQALPRDDVSGCTGPSAILNFWVAFEADTQGPGVFGVVFRQSHQARGLSAREGKIGCSAPVLHISDGQPSATQMNRSRQPGAESIEDAIQVGYGWSSLQGQLHAVDHVNGSPAILLIALMVQCALNAVSRSAAPTPPAAGHPVPSTRVLQCVTSILGQDHQRNPGRVLQMANSRDLVPMRLCSQLKSV